jgi:hypothetical protein
MDLYINYTRRVAKDYNSLVNDLKPIDDAVNRLFKLNASVERRGLTIDPALEGELHEVKERILDPVLHPDISKFPMGVNETAMGIILGQFIQNAETVTPKRSRTIFSGAPKKSWDYYSEKIDFRLERGDLDKSTAEQMKQLIGLVAKIRS